MRNLGHKHLGRQLGFLSNAVLGCSWAHSKTAILPLLQLCNIHPTTPRSGASVSFVATESGVPKDPALAPISPPIVVKKPFPRSAHGIVWDDPYQWLENREDPAVQQHLKQESKYAKAVLARTRGLQKELVDEMTARMATSEGTPPERWGDWWYFTKIPDGQEYPVYYRTPHAGGGDHRATSSAWSAAAAKLAGWGQGLWGADRSTEVILDQNVLAEEFGYAHIGMCKMSKDHACMAYTLDTRGDERFTLFVKRLAEGACVGRRHAKDLSGSFGFSVRGLMEEGERGRGGGERGILEEHVIENVGSVEWAGNEYFFYTVCNSLQRPDRVFRRRLDQKAGEEDELVFEEKDPGFYLALGSTKDMRYVTINSNSRTTSEVRIVDSEAPLREPTLISPREDGVEYFVEHHQGHLYILTNATMHDGTGTGGDLRVVRTPADQPSRTNWKDVLQLEEGAPVEDMSMFRKHCVVHRRRTGLPCLEVHSLPLSPEHPPREVRLPQRVCAVLPGANQDFEATSFRFTVSSPNMPSATFDCDLKTGDLTLLQQEEILGITPQQPPTRSAPYLPLASSPLRVKENRSPSSGAAEESKDDRWSTGNDTKIVDLSDRYTCQQLEVKSHDGTLVPLTLTTAVGAPRDATCPALLVGYGAYGHVLEASWNSDRLSLLDRGWAIALAHVRGGGEKGKGWHLGGTLQAKHNSFEDLIACATFLSQEGFAHPHRIAAEGTSAGGLLVGAVANLRPDLFQAIIAKVPFVDVCNTMLNPELPLTAQEYNEWGDPARSPQDFQRIRAYAPYDNVRTGVKYPAMLVTASLNDTRVGYWEPAKWVARLREEGRSDPNRPILLQTSMDAGHFGEGGRYMHLKDTAIEYAFLLHVIGHGNM